MWGVSRGRATGVLVLGLGSWAVAIACADGQSCTRKDLPKPMSEVRARELAPEVSTGLAVSTTAIEGDCSGEAVLDASFDPCGDGGVPCLRERRAFRVFVVEPNQSLPVVDDCPGAHPVSAMEALAAVDARSSSAGELVLPLSEGWYGVFLTDDDRCARCGLGGAGGACLVEVREGRVTVMDLAFDRARH